VIPNHDKPEKSSHRRDKKRLAPKEQHAHTHHTPTITPKNAHSHSSAQAHFSKRKYAWPGRPSNYRLFGRLLRLLDLIPRTSFSSLSVSLSLSQVSARSAFFSQGGETRLLQLHRRERKQDDNNKSTLSFKVLLRPSFLYFPSPSAQSLLLFLGLFEGKHFRNIKRREIGKREP
jgi:hypothetical protein